MNGTAIMQVIAAIFIATSAGYDVTIGNIIGYSAVQAMRKSGMSYAVYVLPINQMIIMIVCIVLAQFILTYLISKNFNKESLIDRVRYSE